MKKVMITFSLISTFLTPGTLAFADTASLVNHVSAYANTGGNSNGNTTTGGQASASVHVEQTVNGVEQPPIDVATSTGIGFVSIKVNSNVTVTGSSTLATSSMEIDRSASGSLILPKPFIKILKPPLTTSTSQATIPATTTTSSTVNQHVSPGFLHNLKIFFQNIFGRIFKF